MPIDADELFGGMMPEGPMNGSEGMEPMPLPQTAIEVSDPDQLYAALVKRPRRTQEAKPTTEERELIVDRIIRDFTDAASTHRAFRADHVKFMNNWRGTPEPVEDGPIGEASANVKVPLTSTFIEQWKARFISAVFSNDRIVEFQSTDHSIDPDTLRSLGEWFQWELEHVVRFEDVLDAILHYTLVDGVAMPIPRYERIEEERFSTREFQYDDEVPLETQIQLALEVIFQGERVESVVPGRAAGSYEIQIQHEDTPTHIVFLLDKDLLVAEIKRTEVVFDGVRIQCPDIEDVVIINTAPDLDKLPFFGLRTWISAAEFRKEAESGIFSHLSKDDVDKIIATAGEKRPTIIPIDRTDEQDLIEGTASTGSMISSGDEERLWIEFYRWEGYASIKGKRVSVLATVAADARVLAHLARLEELNPSGQRSPVKFDFIRVPNRFYSIGLAEWLQHCQAELDGIHNYRLNSGLITNVPYGFYEPAAGFPRDMLQLKPGRMYPVKNVKGIMYPNIPWNPIWGFNEEALTRKYANELAGIGDQGTGSFISKRTTAVESLRVEQSVVVRTERIVRNFLTAVERLLQRVFELYQRHSRGERVYAVAGPEGEQVVETISKSLIGGRLRLMVLGSARALPAQQERDLAISMFQLLMNPALIQMGIVGADTIFNSLQRIMKVVNYRGVPLHPPVVPPNLVGPGQAEAVAAQGQEPGQATPASPAEMAGGMQGGLESGMMGEQGA